MFNHHFLCQNGIRTDAFCTLKSSSFSNFGNANPDRSDGAIATEAGAAMRVENCTFTNNLFDVDLSSQGFQGTVYTDDLSLTVTPESESILLSLDDIPADEQSLFPSGSDPAIAELYQVSILSLS